MRFLSRSDLAKVFEGRSVAIVGSGPGVLDNTPGVVDSHDVVVRVNNYRLSDATGRRTDVFYSFFGNSIRKSAAELKRDGVSLCMCKCPDAMAIHSPWHLERRRLNGVDFRYIYRNRAEWWFCDTYIPETSEFLETFRLLGERVPTTGFSAILAVLSHKPRSVYLTGFDFFSSGIHSVYEPWEERNADDPIRHSPEREMSWLRDNIGKHPITLDPVMHRMIRPKAPMEQPSPMGDFKARAVAVAGSGVWRRSALNIRDGAGVFKSLLGGGRYKTALEIGTFRGVSAAYMAQFCERVITIDLVNGQNEKFGGFDRKAFWAAMGIENIDLRLVNSNQEKADLIASLDFDFAFVDGDHRGSAPAKDFELVKRCGAVLLHDHDVSNPGPVVELVKTLPQEQVETMDIFAFWRAA
jgi:predicted O-methyltransferase YrrM